MSFGFGVSDFLAVLQLASTVRKQFVDAPGQLQAIADDILRDIEDNEPADSLPLEQQRTLNEISQGCRDVLYELINTLVQYEGILPGETPRPGLTKAGRRVWARLTFDQAKIDAFRGQIATDVNSFELFLAEVTRQLSRETNDIVAATQLGVPSSLSTKTSSDAAGPELAGAGNPRDEFTKWIAQDGKTPCDQPSLFCPGLPGAGKMFLTAIVVDEPRVLQQRRAALAFFYCNFREKMTLAGILAVLLRQLVQRLESVPGDLETVYLKHLNSGTGMGVDECLSVLASVLAVLPKTFVILDVLDECHLPAGQRKRLTELFSLQKVRNLGLFVTARDIPDVAFRYRLPLGVDLA